MAASKKKPKNDSLQPAAEPLDRFKSALRVMANDDQAIGVAVSGGPDSIALLLLAVAARPGKVEAATVDHRLREESGAEAEMVAALCKRLGVPHETLVVEWEEKPTSALQERARIRRYQELAGWAKRRDITFLATGHHADDQAETLLMRLVRGSGVRGLGAIRAFGNMPGTDIVLGRPLLNWTKKELEAICADAAIEPALDPGNADPAFERVRMRQMLEASDWLDPIGLAKSATLLSQADQALNWAARQEWEKRVKEDSEVFTLDQSGLPNEITRRLVSGILARLATEGRKAELRGRELDGLMAALLKGRKATLRGVLCQGGERWQFAKAPQRKSASPRSGSA
jgi:tRNA(Ile)-lysidine synthase